MTDLPYTDDDLRAEAARQHAGLTDDPDFMGVGEAMEDRAINPERVALWGDLGEDDYNAAQRAIHDLINGAADTSRWAINLGADGLKPIPGSLNIKDSHGEDRVRLHLAFAPDMDEGTRKAVIDTIADAIRRS